MKKLPKDAEASNILVGEVEELDAPFSVFIRLNKGVYLGDHNEVPLPTRFIFILLGPTVSLDSIFPKCEAVSFKQNEDSPLLYLTKKVISPACLKSEDA